MAIGQFERQRLSLVKGELEYSRNSQNMACCASDQASYIDHVDCVKHPEMVESARHGSTLCAFKPVCYKRHQTECRKEGELINDFSGDTSTQIEFNTWYTVARNTRRVGNSLMIQSTPIITRWSGCTDSDHDISELRYTMTRGCRNFQYGNGLPSQKSLTATLHVKIQHTIADCSKNMTW